MESDFEKDKVSPLRLVDKCIHTLMPPAAREATLGDLYELSDSSSKFIRSALQTLPYVVFSQARRTLNLPSLTLQAFALYACLGGFFPISIANGLWLVATVATITALIGLTLRDVYRTTEERTSKRAFIDAITAALCVVVVEGIMCRHIGFNPTHPLNIALGSAAFPLIFLLRIELGLDAYIRTLKARPITLDALRHEYQQFERRVLRRNRMEVAACTATASLGIYTHLNFKSEITSIGWATVAVLICITCYLVIRGAAKHASGDLDFQALSTLHQSELMRQHSIRSFMYWWWFTPLIMGLALYLITRGYQSGQPIVAASGLGLTLLLCWCVSSINRKRGFAVAAKIKLLSALNN